MKKGMFVHALLFVVLVGLGFAAINSTAVTITTNSSPSAFSVVNNDLLQTSVATDDIDCSVSTYYVSGLLAELTDGAFGTPNADGGFTIAYGTMTFLLSTVYCPGGYNITNVNTYTGWKDQGRVDQKYTVSFRKVGSDVFTDSVTIYYEGTNNHTFVGISDLNLTGVDAVRFYFPNQQNLGVGYREFDVLGSASALSYSVTKETTTTGYTVLNDDLLQTDVESTDDKIGLYYENGYVNEGVPALTDGIYGAVDAKGAGCAISNGVVTYNLDLNANPAGYNITNVDTYAGWQDSGRDNQYYTVSFRKVGARDFSGGVYVYYVSNQGSTLDQTHVNIAGLGLTGVAAVRFDFPLQENSGVGYKEIDVMGSALDCIDVTRLDSGSKVITNDVDATVCIIEGTGSAGDITLEAVTNTIRYLCQRTTAGVATVDPAGDILALDGICLQSDAGGLIIEAGTLRVAQERTLSIDNSSMADLTINAAITDNRSVASFLSKSGSGALNLNGTNTYGGVTIFGGGIVNVASLSNYGADGSLGNRNNLSDRAREVGLLFQGGTLRYSGNTPQSTDRAIRIRADQNDGFGGNAVIDASGSTSSATLSFTASSSPDFFQGNGARSLSLIGSNTGNNIFNIAIGESGGATTLIKSGAGTWVATGANTYSGGTLIEEGTLRSPDVGSGAVYVAEGATWDVGIVGQTVAGLYGTGSVMRSWGKVSTGSNGEALISTNKNYVHLLDFGNGTAATVNGVTFDSIGVTNGIGWSLAGCAGFYPEPTSTNGYAQLVSDFRYNGHPGVLTFSNLSVGQLYNIVLYTKVNWWKGRRQDATFTNGSDVYQLIYTEPGDYGYYAFRFVANGTTASISMSPYTSDSFHWFAASLEIEDPLPLTVGDSNDYTFAGVISGPTTLIKQGSGKLTLSGTNTYSGDTTVSAGTLEITEGDSLPSSTSLEIASDAAMVLNNSGEQIVTALTVDGVPLYKGTWGSVSSSAEHDSPLFTGTGILNVLTGPAPPGMMILIR